MPITVRVPSLLRELTGNVSDIQGEGQTLKELINDLDARFPGIRAKLYDKEGNLHKFINIYVNENDARFLQQDSTPLKDGDEVSFIPAVSGG